MSYGRRWTRVRFRLVVCLLGLAAGRAETAGADVAKAECQARQIGDRIVVDVQLAGFVEEETLRLLRLGMKGRIRVEAAVLQKRWGLFEDTLVARTVEAELTSAPDKQLLLGRTPVDPAAPIPLERVALRLPAGAVGHRWSVRAEVWLQVVTTSSLSKVAAWATESSEQESSSSIVTRGLVAAVVNDLTRSGRCTCAVTAPAREPRRAEPPAR